MTEDLVSTVIPVHNRARQLREAVASVLAQDYRPIEIIIVNDGSTDGTAACARELAAMHPKWVRIVDQPNRGPGAAREAGRLAAQGEFLQYLDSDDILLPGKFGAQVQALRREPLADVAYGITYLREASGRLIERPHKLTGEWVATMFPAFLVSRWWDTSTPLYRASVTDAAGAWTTLRQEEDWEYDCRIAALGGRLAWVRQPVSESRDHSGIRLSGAGGASRASMRDRASSHALILSHAMRAGLEPESHEMQHFARGLFLLSRQCGAAGLAPESKQLFELSLQAAGRQRSKAADYRLYRLAAGIVGWRCAGQVSRELDRIRAVAKSGIAR